MVAEQTTLSARDVSRLFSCRMRCAASLFFLGRNRRYGVLALAFFGLFFSEPRSAKAHAEAPASADAEAPASEKDDERAVSVEVEAIGAMSFVANASSVGPSYAGDPGVGVGGRAGLLLPHRFALAFLGIGFPSQKMNWTMQGDGVTVIYRDGDLLGSHQLELNAGYDALFGRFHLRPTLGVGYVHYVYRYEWWTPAQSETLRIVSHGVCVVPGLSGFFDVHPNLFFSATLRFPIAFRVGEGDAFESLGDRDFLMSFTFGFGGRFG